MSQSFRVSITVLMVVAGVVPIAVSMRLVAERPAVAFLMLMTGTAVLVIARNAWRWMADPAEGREG